MISMIYRDGVEQLPHRMPAPKGRKLTITTFVDASHAANLRSHTGYAVFINRTPIVCIVRDNKLLKQALSLLNSWH
jgi:hypothetical protein